MPTYEYECESRGLRFERQQSILESPIGECPECRGNVHRLVRGGAGFILKGGAHPIADGTTKACSMETRGRTCCGRDERCSKPPCGERS